MKNFPIGEDLVKVISKRKAKRKFLGITLRACKWSYLIEIIATIGLVVNGLPFALNMIYFIGFTTVIMSEVEEKIKELDFGDKLILNIRAKIKKKIDVDCYIGDYDDFEIIPVNIKVGEDLNAANAIPIFKEGHYILVRNQVIIQQYRDDDDKIQLEILEPDEVKDVYNNIDDNTLQKLEKESKKKNIR